ncbi:hypothetical protein DFP73DRAFT_592821 [Morchella snyderi]|nr:hypothetical protein DFP73DRAFT_592821 [Morchella snyderi]
MSSCRRYIPETGPQVLQIPLCPYVVSIRPQHTDGVYEDKFLNTTEWNSFIQLLMIHMSLDVNLIALEGPEQHGPAWEEWVDRYINTFVRMTYYINDVFKGAVLSLGRWLRLKAAYEKGFFNPHNPNPVVVNIRRQPTFEELFRGLLILYRYFKIWELTAKRQGSPSLVSLYYHNTTNAHSHNDIRHFGIDAYMAPHSACEDRITFQSIKRKRISQELTTEGSLRAACHSRAPSTLRSQGKLSSDDSLPKWLPTWVNSVYLGRVILFCGPFRRDFFPLGYQGASVNVTHEFPENDEHELLCRKRMGIDSCVNTFYRNVTASWEGVHGYNAFFSPATLINILKEILNVKSYSKRRRGLTRNTIDIDNSQIGILSHGNPANKRLHELHVIASGDINQRTSTSMSFSVHKDTSSKRPAGHVDQTYNKTFPWSLLPRHARRLFEGISTFNQNMAPDENNTRAPEDIPLGFLDQDLLDPPSQPTSSPESSSVNSPELSSVASPELSSVTSPELSAVSSPELSSISSGELSFVSSEAVYSDSEDGFNMYNPRGIRDWTREMRIPREDSDEEDDANGSRSECLGPSIDMEEEEDEFMSVREGKRPAHTTNPTASNRQGGFVSRELSPSNSDEGSGFADSIYRFATSHMDYRNSEYLDYIYIYCRDPPRFLDFVNLLYIKHRIDGFKRIYRLKIILKGDSINFRVGRTGCQYEWEKVLKIMNEENLRAEVLYRTKEEENEMQIDSVPEVAVPEISISNAAIHEVTMPELEQADRSQFLVRVNKFLEDTVEEISATKETSRIKETADSIDQGFKMVKKLFQNTMKVIVGQVGEQGFGQALDQTRDQGIQQGPRRNLKRSADQIDEESVKENAEQEEKETSDIDYMEVDDI